MRPHVADLARIADTYTSSHPNAGLPNAFGGYDEQPHETSELLRSFAEEGFVNIVGGCCGTTPEHTRQIAEAVHGLAPPHGAQRTPRPHFSGLEPFEIGPDTGFVMIGERTNVTGSARFRRLIEVERLSGRGLAWRSSRCAAAPNVLDVNMDADLLDAEQAMTDLPQPARDRARGRADPDHGRQLPLLARSRRASSACRARGSSTRSASRRARKRSSKAARTIRGYGAGVVVMAFDEEGQADTGRAQGRDLRSRLRPPDRVTAGRRRTSSSTRTSSPSRPGSRSTTASRRRSSSRCR